MMDSSLLLFLAAATEPHRDLRHVAVASADDLGAHVRTVQHARQDHGLQHPSQRSMPRLNVRNVHFPRLRHLSKRDLGLLGRQKTATWYLPIQTALKSSSMHLFVFHVSTNLADISVFEKQKRCHWELVVKQEDVFFRCRAHSGEDLVDDVLYIDSALVGK